MEPDSYYLAMLSPVEVYSYASAPLLVAAMLLYIFFTMSEAAIVTLNDAKLRKQALSGNKKAIKITRLVEHPTRFFAALKVGGSLCAFFAFAMATDMLGTVLRFTLLSGSSRFFWAMHQAGLSWDAIWRASVAAAYLLAGIVCACVILILGDFVPRRLAIRHHERFAFFAVGPLNALATLLRPLVIVISAASGGILRLLGLDPKTEEEPVTEEEIRMLLDEGSEEGNIEESDKDMINNIFDFGDTEVSELMIHRTEVVALEREADLREVIETAVESGCTRIPVYEGDLDSIVGILHIKDLLGLITHGQESAFDISVYLRDPFYAAESMSCKLLFATMKEKKQQIAVVVDEYGGTAGIITMEDLIEGIVGDIQDEYDEEEEEEIAQSGAGSYLIDGIADLEEVVKTLGFTPEEDELEEFETIGGYIIHKLGYIPEEGEQPTISIGGILFTVEAMEDRRIAKLMAKIIDN